MSTEFRVTFGQKYRREDHPTLPEAHPDGWLAVFAADEHQARLLTFDKLGTAWSMLRPPMPDDLDWYPRGELARLSADGEASS